MSQGAITSSQRRRRLHQLGGGRCFYCGMHISANGEPLPRDWLHLRGTGSVMLTPEHKTPISRGGADNYDNLVGACSRCNAAKGSLTVDEFRLVHGLRLGNLSIAFHGEPPRVERDWLCVHSRAFERNIFAASYPGARKAYSRGKLVITK